MPPDFAALRRHFPVLAHKTYLNSGSYGALADSVRAAFESYLDDRLRHGARWDAWVDRLERVRALTASLINASAAEVAITPSVSDGLNALASALDFSGRRNQVVVSDFEFPTNAQIWHAQASRGARVVHVRPDAGGHIPPERFAAAIGEETRLVAVTHVCYRNGARLDIGAIARVARERGALMLVDCYQSVGSMCVDVRALDVDFAVGGMLKYLLGTAGIGFLYVRAALLDALVPTHSGWFAQEDIGAMDITGNRPAPDARRFESGTPPVPNCYAAEAGLQLIASVGLPAIEARNRALTQHCLEALAGIGWPSITPPEPAQRGMTLAIPARDADALVRELAARDIVTSQRDGNVRASFHFYNDHGDIDALIGALRGLRAGHARAAAAGGDRPE